VEAGPLQVLYLAHDLDDSAIWRRCEMLRRGGAEVRLAGFRRGDGPLAGPAVVLGQTRNGRMAGRALAVARAAPGLAERLGPGPVPDVILARNLEMLALAVSLRRRFPAARVVYELLDIHRLLLGGGVVSHALRAAEAALMRRASLVILSSPGFVRNYLKPFNRPARDVLLVENKPLGAALSPLQSGEGPIRIGWFGILRCAWSLKALDQLTRAEPGRWQVVLRGRPALDAVPDFHTIVAANPDLSYNGPYRWPDDLAAIYSGIDIAWLIDRYEAGGNSDWLLPNRLYEGCLHGAVPLGLDRTEVATRLRALGVGIVARAPEDAALREALAMDRADVARMRAALLSLPRQTWEAGADDCRAIVARLRATRRGPLLKAEVMA
jgi:succinoglycan biosynthesis protein ExoL